MKNKGRFDNGISYYTSGYLPVHFPEDVTSCGQCLFCYLDGLDRPKCRVNGQLVYSTETMSPFCPIVLDRDINEPVEQVDEQILGVRV